MVIRNRFTDRIKTVSGEGALLASAVSLNVLALSTPLVILLVFDRVIPFQSLDTLKLLSIALISVAVLEFFLRWARSVLSNTSASRAAQNNIMVFLRQIFSADSSRFAGQAAALHLERYGAIGRLRDLSSGQQRALAIDAPFAVVFLGLILLIGGWLVLVPLTALALVLLFSQFFKTKQRDIFEARKTLDRRRYAFLSDALTHAQTLKVNTMERQMMRRFELLENQTVATSHRLILFSGLVQSCGAILSQLSVAAIGLLGAYLVIFDRLGLAELAACMLLNGRAMQPLIKLVSLRVHAEGVAASKAKLAEIEALGQASPNIGQKPPLRGLIEVSGLAIAGGDLSFEASSFCVASGEVVSLDAPHADAASAFFDMVLAMRGADRGQILIDGYVPLDRTAQRGSGGLALVENPAAVFSGTLMENISAFGTGAQIERALQVSEQLGLEKRVHRLPMGYNTQLNTGGVFERDPINRQLISLTRAFALAPKIILMHEPSAVLGTSERETLAAFLADLSPRPTMVLYTPDPRLTRVVDRTVQLAPPISATARAWLEDAQLPSLSAPDDVRGAA